MSNIKIIALGDLHLGKALGRKKKNRMQVFKNLHLVSQNIKKEKPDIVLLAGDIFDKDTLIAPDTINQITYFLNFIKKHTKLIIAIAGNHDSISKYYDISFVDFLSEIDSKKIISVSKDWKTITYKNIDIVAIPHNRKLFEKIEDDKELTLIDSYIDEYLFDNFENNRFKILLSHFSLDCFIPFAEVKWEYFQNRSNKFDLCILGDLHNNNYSIDNLYYTGCLYPTNYRDLLDHPPGYKMISIDEKTYSYTVETIELPRTNLLFIKDENSFPSNIEEDTIIYTNSIAKKKELETLLDQDKVIDIVFYKEINFLQETDDDNKKMIIDDISSSIDDYIKNITNNDAKKIIKELVSLDITSEYSQTDIDSIIENIILKNLYNNMGE